MAKLKTRQKVRNGVLLFFFSFPVVLSYLSPFLSAHGAAAGIVSSANWWGLRRSSPLIPNE